MQDLRARAAHFDFGANWRSFAAGVDERRILEAAAGLERLFPDGEIQGRRFLDIGSGSGLSLLAALRLGACDVVGFDIDEDSVGAARHLLTGFAPEGQWQVFLGSVFDADASREKRFDIVYSWGVLHHTGDLWLAVKRAAEWVAEDGLLALALYRKTRFCGFWRREKRLYAHLPAALQAPIRWSYQAAWIAGSIALRQNPFARIRDYHKNRGMSWTHDVHDWLGGYPYESATADEVRDRLNSLGFRMVRENVRETRGSGLFGSGCDEYVARRVTDSGS